MKRNIKVLSGACGILVAVLLLVAGCEAGGSGAGGHSGGGVGRGGSMARFTIHGDYLYTVDNQRLTVVSVVNPAKPIDLDEVRVGSEIETIFAKDTLLFIGSQTAMYIYDIADPKAPKQLSVTSHLRSCDPVVAYDTLAFVTLNSSIGTWCGDRGDVLQVYDVSDIGKPERIAEVSLSSPRGLAVDGEAGIVFVCDGGVEAFDISDPRDIRKMYGSGTLPEVGRIDAYDCIALDGRLLVIGEDGLYQLGYGRGGFTFISKIDLR